MNIAERKCEEIAGTGRYNDVLITAG